MVLRSVASGAHMGTRSNGKSSISTIAAIGSARRESGCGSRPWDAYGRRRRFVLVLSGAESWLHSAVRTQCLGVAPTSIDDGGVENQVFSYGKGNFAYHLTVLTRDRDVRVLPTVLIFLPIHYLKRLMFWVGGDRAYPLRLTLLEIAGILAGPWSWWRSRQIIRHIQRDRLSP